MLTFSASARPRSTNLREISRRRLREDPVQRQDEGFDQFLVASHDGAGQVLAHGDLVAKGRHEQMRVGIATDIAQERLVIDIAALVLAEARGFGDPHCQDAAP